MTGKVEVLQNVREMLAMAEAGLADATGRDPTRRRPGTMNLFTYGRTVTLTMQTIKSYVSGFNEWWRPFQDEMADDPLMVYFNQARVDVIHQGALKTSTSLVIGSNGPVDLGSLMQELSRHAPPNTVGTFLGEGSTGGNGWEVMMPDGSKSRIYFNLPDDVDIQTTLHLPNPPTVHFGKPIVDTSVANLGCLYVESLRNLVEHFEDKWL
ncbi:MAG: hypothetical protein ACYC1I_11950 [Acidimicrobiales bacterium]